MSISQKTFLSSTEATYALNELSLMEDSREYVTEPTFTMTTDTNSISFAQRHLEYLSRHTNVNPLHYISNLKLMTKKS